MQLIMEKHNQEISCFRLTFSGVNVIIKIQDIFHSTNRPIPIYQRGRYALNTDLSKEQEVISHGKQMVIRRG